MVTEGQMALQYKGHGPFGKTHRYDCAMAAKHILVEKQRKR